MISIVTPEEMAAIDAEAPEPVEVLIGRAGSATAWAALRLLGGAYGRRVVVLAGKGNNGNDGRDAATKLRRRGVRVDVVPAAEAPSVLPPADLIIDAAYGTGFRGEFHAPTPTAGGADGGRPVAVMPPVLAVDIPSGVDGLSGEVRGRPLAATSTVTFAALKPGLVLTPGRELAGDVQVAPIGLDTSRARAALIERSDVASWLPRAPVDSHKWKTALLQVAGSPGMTGAAVLAASAALRAGAGMLRYLVPGVAAGQVPQMPIEAIGLVGDRRPWDDVVAAELADERLHALVVGPGLGRDPDDATRVRKVVSELARSLPLVVDGDGLTALAEGDMAALRGRSVPAILTPHDGEFVRLSGRPVPADRIAAARDLARETGAVVLLKGATTVVAHPDGRARLSTTGDARLATAGTGDVLSGILGGLLAAQVDPFDAAAAGAWLHGAAARTLPGAGLVAGDIVATLPATLATVRSSVRPLPDR